MTNVRKFLSLSALLLCGLSAFAGRPSSVGHDLEVRIDPEQGTLAVTDRLDLPDDLVSWDFFLHEGLKPEVLGGNAKLTRIGSHEHLEHFQLDREGSTEVALSYGGRIQHQLEDIREGVGRERQSSRGVISAEGIVLDGFSGWYPRDPERLQRLDLRLQLPDGWLAVSQGAGPEVSKVDKGVSIRWRETRPQDDIYLIAAPFQLYEKVTANGVAQVYLRRADPELAKRYLEATDRYLALYSALIGPYPYAKFALVENFWDTGFGMPSFTLLGPRVIRLPFIIHTSYPHEVLHNWWGNGVYVDYATGNWSEGLTTYLADHLLAEQRGGGADYRRDSLRAYADYVRAAEDFPVHDFHGRHGSVSQAIGYGKAMMVLHMLRRNLGDETFVAGLRRFYRDNLFRTASFDDLRLAMEHESGHDLKGFFRNWVDRTGAPEIALEDVKTERGTKGYLLQGRLRQIQPDEPFPLQVPLVVHLEGGGTSEHQVPLNRRSADFELDLPDAAIRVDVDPRFDLFRTLAPGESPVTLGALFGSENGLIVLPADAPAQLAAGYRRLAEAWRKGSSGWEIATDADLGALPQDRPVWLLGWSNRFLGDLAAGQARFRLDAKRHLLHLVQDDYQGKDFSLALASRRGGQPVGWVASLTPGALPGLARKLPHYGKYSYLVFQGEAPDNRLKGQWQVQDSSLMVWMGNRRESLSTPPLPPLTAVLE